MAEAKAKAALPSPFEGNALALFQMVYRDPTNDLRVRLDAAKSAIAYELPKPEFATPAGDVMLAWRTALVELAKMDVEYRDLKPLPPTAPQAPWFFDGEKRPRTLREFTRGP